MGYDNKLKTYIQYFFLIFFVIIFFPAFFYKQPTEGLDPSWNIALHLAYKYKLVFGKGFIFTYGPLGILHSRLAISTNKYVYLLFDLYLMCSFFFLLKGIFKKHFNPLMLIFIFLSMMISQYAMADQWYFFFFLFFLFSFIKEPQNKIYLIQAALLSIICFYFKVSSGIVAVALFVTAITYVNIIRNVNLKLYGIILLSFIISILLVAQVLSVNLKGYITTSLLFIKDYNDSMVVPLKGEYLQIFGDAAIIIFLIVIALCVFWMTAAIWKKQFLAHLDVFFVCVAVALSVFVLFKSAFVRADGHIFIFFQNVSVLVGLLYLFGPQSIGKKVGALCCYAVLIISFVVFNFLPGNYEPFKRIVNLSFLPIKVFEVKNYFTGIRNYNEDLAKSDKLTSQQNELKNLVGDHSVDIIPSEISKIYFNGLRYSPRPVIQSYAVYNRYLDSLNYERYMSPEAPDYILFSVASIDDRYPLFDESKTKLAVLNHYSVVGFINGDLILKKKNVIQNLVKEKKEETVNVKMGEDILIKPNSGIQFSRFFIDYTLGGNVNKFLYQPPALKIIFTLENNETKTFKAIKPILNAGVVINKFINSEQEFQLLMLSEGRISPNIKKIRIEADSASEGFVKNIKMVNTYYMFNKSTEERLADSVAIARLVNGYIPLKPFQVNTVITKEGFNYGVDVFNDYSQFIRVEGWAFYDKINNDKIIVKPVLKLENKLYDLPTKNRIRSDLPEVYDRKDIENCGFISIVNKTQLPPGKYQLALIVFDPVNGTSWIKDTDQHTSINSNYSIQKLNADYLTSKTKKDIEYFIDSIEEKENDVLVQGWAVAKDENARMITNLILKNIKTVFKVNTDLIKRPDLLGRYKNPLSEYAGFTVQIPKNELPRGIYSIGIEKIDQDGKSRSWIFTDKKLRVRIPDIVTPMQIISLPPIEDFFANIEVFKDDKRSITISGWAVQEMTKMQNSTIKIVLKNDNSIFSCDTEPVFRPDVTASFKGKFNLDDCGFSVRISKNELPIGKYQVGIHVFQEGQIGEMKFTDKFVIKD